MKTRAVWSAGAVVLGVALAANVWNGNRLWTAYTLVGVVLFAAFLALDRRGIVRIPPGTLLAMTVLGALHFLGGSLAGVHRGFGVNGAYYVFPWWDNVAHFLGGGVVWMLADVVLRDRLGIPTRRVATSVAAVAFAALAGIAVELYEFTGFIAFGTVDQGFYVNTMLDLYYDVLGAAAIAVSAHQWARWWGTRSRAGADPA